MAENETRENDNLEQPGSAPRKTESIPYDRFKQVIAERNNLQADLANLEAQIDSWKAKYEKSTKSIEELNVFKTELEEIKKNQFEKNLSEWKVKQKIFEVEEGDPNYEKVQKIKHRFKFGEDLQPSEVAQNMEIIKTYDEIDYFQSTKESTGFNSKKPQGTTAVEEFGGYKTIEEWARHDWKAAGKWLKEH